MDAEALTLLEGDLEAQAGEIARIHSRVRRRIEGFEHSDERMESLAFQLHNLYCAYEDLFRLVAEAFENQIGEGGAWHVELLTRMRRDIPGVRPAILQNEEYQALNELRAFRHAFRHAYAVELRPAKLRIVLDQALLMEPRTAPMVTRFMAASRRMLA